MTQPKQKNNIPPKKFHPKGLSILHEDRDILVVDKCSGLLSVSSDKVVESTAYHLLTDYVKKGAPKSRNRIFIVHRLDRDTSGIMVFAKSEKAKHYLQDEWKHFTKTYCAVVEGRLKEKEGLVTSYLTENSVHKMYSTNDSEKGKLAKTGYKVIRESERFTLVEIDLQTGKKNQIRVHLGDLGCPVAGDKKYGAKIRGVKRLALHAASLSLLHPHTHKSLTFTTKMPEYFKTLLKSV